MGKSGLWSCVSIINYCYSKATQALELDCSTNALIV